MENQITATYGSDSKRYHRFLIDEGQRITGTIYVPKDKKVPNSVTIFLKTRGERGSKANS
jgi:hypothetical protein